MAYTDLSAAWAYKALITYQKLDQHGENDKVFNDLLTAVTDFSVNLKFDNNKGITGEIAAGSTYKNLVKLDASNIVQLSESGTEVRVPADPTNALGVATKQYVDNLIMIGLVAKVRATTTSESFSDVVNISAVGRLVYCAFKRASASGGVEAKISIDGTTFNTLGESAGTTAYAALNGASGNTNMFIETGTDTKADAHFQTSLRVEHRETTGGQTAETIVVYERN